MTKSVAIVTLLSACIVAAGIVGGAFIIANGNSASTQQRQQRAEKSAAEKPADDEKADAWELDRAKLIIDQFIAAVATCDGHSIYGCLSHDYRDRLPPECQEAKSVVYWDRKDKFVGWSTTRGDPKLSPTKDSVFIEVHLLGRTEHDKRLAGEGEPATEPTKVAFSFYTVKDKHSGAWRVDAVQGDITNYTGFGP